jgi:hypothetical protein
MTTKDLTREQLEEMLLIQQRVRYGDMVGNHIGQITGNVIYGVVNPGIGVSKVFGFFGDLFHGAQRGVNVIALHTKSLKVGSKEEQLKAYQEKVKKLKKEVREEEHLSPEKQAELLPGLAALTNAG